MEWRLFAIVSPCSKYAEISSERLGGNTQSNTTQLAQSSHFSKKHRLPQVELNHHTNFLSNALTNWTTKPAQLAGASRAKHLDLI